MADPLFVPYPEGETFFTRAGLATAQQDGYHAESPQHFHSHIMIEYIWNKEADHGSKNANNPYGHYHPRSGYNISKGSNWGTLYGNYTHLPLMYGDGTSNPNMITKRVQHNLCTNGNRFRDYEKGASAEAWFMTMPLPTKNERWLWIDMLAYIRAIYIPIAYSTDQDYPQFSTWVCVNFALDTKKSIYRGHSGIEFLDHQFNSTFGLGVYPDYTLGLDIHGLIELLCIPRQMRKVNVYSAKLIRILPNNYIGSAPLTASYDDAYDFDWPKVNLANRGLDCIWKDPPKNSSWLENYFKNSITFALGMIPGVGPVLAIAFPLAWTAIKDPDNFVRDLKTLVPNVELGLGLVNDILGSAKDSKQYFYDNMLTSVDITAAMEVIEEGERVVKSMQDLGPSPMFIEAAKNLGLQGSYKKESSEEEGEGETIRENLPKGIEGGLVNWVEGK